MKEIQLTYQPFFKPNKKNKLKPSGSISGSFKLIGTFEGFVIASSKTDQSTYLIKLYNKPKKSKNAKKYALLNKVIRCFDNLTNLERCIVMDSYNSDGTVNKELN